MRFFPALAVAIYCLQAACGARVGATVASPLSDAESPAPLVLLPPDVAATADEEETTSSSWSGPSVRFIFSSDGFPRITVDSGPPEPAQFLTVHTSLGNDPVSLARFDAQLLGAKSAGVRIICLCITDDLIYPTGDPRTSPWTNPGHAVDSATDFVFRRAIDLIPDVLLVVRYYLHLPTWPEDVVLMNLSGATSGATKMNSPTMQWAAAAVDATKDMLSVLDATYPGRIAGVFFGFLHTSEWFFPGPGYDAFFDYGLGHSTYSDYSEGMRQEFCVQQGEDSNCVLPTPAERTSGGGGPLGTMFTSPRSAALNAKLSNNVIGAISALSAAAKDVSGGRLLVISFYGYLLAMGERDVSSGHLALSSLLQDPNVDGIASPYAYYKDVPAAGGGGPAIGPRGLGGGFWNQGPMDAASAAGKAWVVEDDTLTSFAFPQHADATCQSSECDGDVLRRNVYAAAMHGAALYWYDVSIQGWFGRPDGDPESPDGQAGTDSMWARIRTALRAVGEVASAPSKSGNRLAAEVAVFIDDESLALMAGAVTNEDITFHDQLLPLLPYEIGAPGAAVSFYMLSDLLLPGLDLSAVRLAVFANSFKVSAEVDAAITERLKNSDRTLVWIYAPAVLPNGELALDPDLTQTRLLTGLPLVSRVDDLWPVKTKLHPEHFSADVPLTFGPTGLRSPYLVVESDHSAFPDVVELGVYDWASSDQVSVAWRPVGTWNSLFIGSPGLPAAAWRDVMVGAGVHLFLGRDAVGTGDWVEAKGRAILVVAAEGEARTRRVYLPSSVGLAAEVRDAETGILVCTDCSEWNTNDLGTGQVQLFTFFAADETQGSSYASLSFLSSAHLFLITLMFPLVNWALRD